MRGTPLHLILCLMLMAVTSPTAQTANDPFAPSTEMKFIGIQPGEFVFGDRPSRLVKIEQAFEVSAFQVTNEQWKSVMGKYRGSPLAGKKFRALVSWNDAQEFLRRMNSRHDGYVYRLPTDQEWEYLARADAASIPVQSGDRVRTYGQTTPRESPVIIFPIGQPVEEPKGLPCGEDLRGQTPCPPPERFPNPWGLYDILGRTSEWVQDWYLQSKYGSTTGIDDIPPTKDASRIVRGSIGNFFLVGDGRMVQIGPVDVWGKNVQPPKTRNIYGFRSVRQPRVP